GFIVNRVRVADQVDRAFQLVAVDDDLDAVAVAELADRAAGEGLRRHVADARPGAHTGKPRVRDHRDVLAERQELQGTRDLVNLLHAAAHRPSATEYEYV